MADRKGKDPICGHGPGGSRLGALLSREVPDDRQLRTLAETFKALADPTRTKILYALSLRELCVCELADFAGLSVSAISHHLRLLRAMRLVKFRRAGRNLYYSLDDEHIENLFREGLKHVRE